MHNYCAVMTWYYLRRRLASGESIVTLGITLSRCVCVSAPLVLAAKVMRCIQCSLVIIVISSAEGCFRSVCLF